MHAVQVQETRLPGVGVRRDLLTESGRRVGVVFHRDGRRELALYDRDDPDACRDSLVLTAEEADTLAELLGAPRIVERLEALHRQVEGLVSEEMLIEAGSPYDGRTLGDARVRTRTGASIVAVIRGHEVHPSPGPDFTFRAGDVVVVVGTTEGTEAVADILANG